MSVRKKRTLEPKCLISLLLSTVLILNVGCQRTCQTNQSSQKLNMHSEGAHFLFQGTTPETTQQETQCVENVPGDFGQFISDTANGLYYVAIGGAAVAIIYLDMSLLCEVF